MKPGRRSKGLPGKEEAEPRSFLHFYLQQVVESWLSCLTRVSENEMQENIFHM